MTNQQIIGIMLINVLIFALGYAIGQYRTEDKCLKRITDMEQRTARDTQELVRKSQARLDEVRNARNHNG